MGRSALGDVHYLLPVHVMRWALIYCNTMVKHFTKSGASIITKIGIVHEEQQTRIISQKCLDYRHHVI